MRFKALLYFLFLYLLIEGGVRFGFVLFAGTHFGAPSGIIYHYYPMVRDIKAKYSQTDHKDYKVLILSCSTLHREWGGFDTLLQHDLLAMDSISSLHRGRYAVFNAAGVGFSSRDNLNCLRLLSALDFDLVIDYSAINDARPNNCPKEVFKEDYSHTDWGGQVSCILRHTEIDYTVVPFLLDYSYQLLYQSIRSDRFIPRHYSFRESWWDYGADLKSLHTFRQNIESIDHLCKQKNEKLLLIPYCFFIPADYTLEKFKNKDLAYTFQRNSRETEIWGKPENVSAFLDSANAIVTGIASRDDNAYLDPRQDISRQKMYYADICHFSMKGLKLFSHLVSDKVKSLDQ